MSGDLNREDARVYREREFEETRHMSLDEKFRRCALLMQAGRRLPDPRRAEEVVEVRDRWSRLREALLG